MKVAKRLNEIVNRLNHSKEEKDVDLKGTAALQQPAVVSSRLKKQEALR